MLSREDNELLTRVGPGTAAGELLRRYWQPVACVAELTEEKPILEVRLLGEELVVYRDKSGAYGLVGQQCSHRFASLAYGRVEEDGIRCPYHGWKYNSEGACIETPAEPRGSTLKDSVRHPAYPVRSLGGMLFAYLGPAPAPALPHWDVLAWEHGRRTVERHSVVECNWLQCMENSVDPSHLFWLHGRTAHLASLMEEFEEKEDFIPFDFGIMKRRTTPIKGKGVQTDQHPLLFPNVLRHVAHDRSGKGGHRHNLQYRVPIDDNNTQVFMVNFVPETGVRSPADAAAPFSFVPMRNESGDYRLDMVLAQDVMAWETQGPVLDRTRERLGSADKGVVMYRRLVKEQIEAVAQGRAPIGVRPAGRESIIELDVINERIGLMRPERQGAAQ
jgi:5,5'-dehydrodivanillate O-demethylase